MIPARYLATRLLALIPVLLGISLLAFTLGVISPGDPAEEALNAGGVTDPTKEEIRLKRIELGLDKPLTFQYIRWLSKALRGDLGISYITREAVTTEILRRLPATLRLSLLAFVFTCFIGITGGLLMAMRYDSMVDKVGRILAVLFISVPGFWLALFLIYVFSERLRLLPSSSDGTFRQLILPAAVLACVTSGITMKLTRASVLQEMRRLYILTAKAKGLSEMVTVIKHAFPNALLPVLTLLGTYFGNIMGGSAVIESIFAIPGMGSFALNAIYGRDYPSIQGYVLFTGGVFVLINLGMDIVYILFNPRIRPGGRIG